MAGLDDYLINPNGNTAPTGTQAANPNQMAVDTIAPSDLGNTGTKTGANPSFASQIEGPFHTKGILGAVLGTVQDAILHDIGAPSQYWNKVAAARQADAVSGWDSDPAGSYLKLASVAGVDAADTHLNNMLSGQYKTAEAAKTVQSTNQAAQMAPIEQQQALFKAQAPAYNLAASIKDATTAKAAGTIIRQMYARNGWDQSQLPSTDDPDSWKQFAAQAIPGAARMTADNTADYRDKRLDQIQQSLAIQQQRADQQGSHQDAMENLASARAARGNPNADLQRQLLQARIDQARAKTTAAPQQQQDAHQLSQARANKLNTAKDGTPLAGYRNARGAVFQGGDPHNPNNWK